MSSNREDKIRQRAHAIWEKEGRPHGAHDRHWHQAASEVDGEGAPAVDEPVSAIKTPAKAKASTKVAAPATASRAAKPAPLEAEAPAPKGGRKALKG